MEYTEAELLALIQPVIELKKKKPRKKILKGSDVNAWQRPLYPKYWEGYDIAASWVDDIKPHAQIGYFPESLFAKRAPNETPEETKYIRENYQQTTLSVFKDYVEVNGRATHPNNWNIAYVQDEEQYKEQEQTLQYYVEKMIPIHQSLENFTFSFLPPLKYMDAMGVVVVKPERIPVEEVNGKLIISQVEMIEPVPHFYHTTRVIHYTSELAIIEWDEYSPVFIGDNLVNEGIVYYAFDKNTIWRIYQSGKKEDYIFEIVEFWRHDINLLPVRRVGGVSIQIDQVKLEMSPFMYAVPTLNDILIDSCMLRGIKAVCCFPYRIMIGDPCEFQIVHEGETMTCDGGYFHIDGVNRECSQCHGSGMKDRVSPYGTLLIKPTMQTEAGDSVDATKAMFYASPSSEMPNLIRKEIEYGFGKSYDSLHMKRSASVEGGAMKEVTATENLSDQKALIASIATNTNQLFDIYEWLIIVHGKMRYMDRFKMPHITRPTNYDIFVESDDLKKINEAIDAGQPPFVVQALIFNFVRKLYYNDIESKLVFDLIVVTDRLISQSSDEINAGLQRGNIETWEKILHDSALSFIIQLKFENPKFFEQTPQVQREQLIKKAQDKAAAMKPVTGATVPSAQARLDDILNS
jgi:hypothetical protein